MNNMSGNQTSPNQNIDSRSAMLTQNQLNNIYPEELLEPNKGIDIREFWRVIMRHQKLLGLFILTTFLITLLLTLLMKPTYRASATIQIERETTKVLDVVVEPSSRVSERDFWQTQIELMKSRRLASKVIKKLDLESTFQPKKGFFSFLSSGRVEPIESSFLKNLTVEPLNNSQLFLISYESGDPEVAAQIVNTLADSYIEMNYERRFEAAQVAKTFLEKEILRAEGQLKSSQQELDDYSREVGIIEIDNNNQTTLSHTLRRLTEELVTAEKNRIGLESELQQLEAISKSRDPSMVIDLPSVQSVKKELIAAEELYRKNLQRYGERSRRTKRALEESERLRGQIRAEANLLREAVNTRYESARQNEEILRNRLKQLQNESLDAQGQKHIFNNKKQQVETSQALYQGLHEKLREVGVVGGLDSQSITIIDRAMVPYKKYKPNIKMNLIFGSLIGLLLGLAAIFLREFMDDSIKDIAELEKESDLPMLGSIPYLKRRSDEDIAMQIVKEPKSKISEAIRSLRTTLSLSTQEGAPKITFITSSGPSEGKSTTTLNLAASYATSGHTVLLIDADLRSPSIHSLLHQDARLGLSNYLTDHCELSTIIQSSTIPGLYSIVSGPLPPDPVELLSGKRMDELLDKAKMQYDYVIIDGPPVLGLADALILANKADATILTVHSGQTRKGQISTTLKRLRQAQAHVIGTLLNQASFKGSGYSYDYLHYSYGPNAGKKKNFFNKLFS